MSLDDIITLLQSFTAVGRVAERALTLLSVPHEAVRHPSMGGATEFAVGMRRLCLRAA